MNILCPVCNKILSKNGKSYCCENGHSFDLAKEGYLNLNLKNSQKTGDNPQMIKARQAFLEKGYYSFLRDELIKHLDEDDRLVDLACGEGYYTSAFPCRDKIGIDLSKSGLKIASKKDKSTLYLLNSIFHNPLEDESCDKLITIFAPIAKQEIVRLLKKEGQFILVKPDVFHLYELKEVIYRKPYVNEVSLIEIEGLTPYKELSVRKKVTVEKEDIMNLFMMTPYVNTTSAEDKEKLNDLNNLEITFAFIIDIYKKG